MKRALLVSLFACGGATATPVVIPSVTSDASTPIVAPPVFDASTPVADASKGWTLTLLGETTIAGGVYVDGPSFSHDGSRVAVVHKDKLHMFDATTLAPIAVKGGTITKAAGPLMVVGRYAFDASTGERLVLAVPKGGACDDEDAFSADAARMSRACNGGTAVFDTHTGSLIGTFREFQSAAPVRTGSITASGNFVFWQARASGAFEEIKSHVTGPMTSSHTTMSPDERFLFSAPDRNWYPDAVPIGTLIDAKNGHTILTFTGDVESGVFSPRGQLLAVLHKVMGSDQASVTIHSVDHTDVLVRLPDRDVMTVSFSDDDTRVAVLTAAHKLRVYRLLAP